MIKKIHLMRRKVFEQNLVSFFFWGGGGGGVAKEGDALRAVLKVHLSMAALNWLGRATNYIAPFFSGKLDHPAPPHAIRKLLWNFCKIKLVQATFMFALSAYRKRHIRRGLASSFPCFSGSWERG